MFPIVHVSYSTVRHIVHLKVIHNLNHILDMDKFLEEEILGTNVYRMLLSSENVCVCVCVCVCVWCV
jgi:hypothetical protein